MDINQVKGYVEIGCQFIGALSVLATLVVKLTPSPKDDELLEGFMAKFMKVVSYLPTLGINPRTQKLEEAYLELKGKSDAATPEVPKAS